MTLPGTPMTRRACLTTLAAAALAPRRRLVGAEEKSMRGAFMILSTPYAASGEVDYEDLAGEVEFCERCGIEAIVWPQNSSEQRYLSMTERLRGFDTLARANAGRAQALVLGVQADDTTGMLEYARHAEALAPDAMIAIPPRTPPRWTTSGATTPRCARSPTARSSCRPAAALPISSRRSTSWSPWRGSSRSAAT